MDLAELVGAIDTLPDAGWEGKAFRHVGGNRPPLSGEGARFTGGRWNPPGSFPVLYLGASRDVAVAEFRRLAVKQRVAPESFLPRTFYTYDIKVTALLDLRDEASRAAVDLKERDLVREDLRGCQSVGEAAHASGREGIVVPGAAGSGDVLAIFIAQVRPTSLVNDVEAELWGDVALTMRL
jgi:RES domain-containing protein